MQDFAADCNSLQNGKILTQNPSEAIPWGFDSPSRHHLKSQYPLLNHRLAALVSALCFGCFLVGATLRYEFRYSAHPLSFQYLGSLVADFISADYPYLLQITKCAADCRSRSFQRSSVTKHSESSKRLARTRAAPQMGFNHPIDPCQEFVITVSQSFVLTKDRQKEHPLLSG